MAAKKRQKTRTVSFPKALREQSMSFSTPAIIRRAQSYPLVECRISVGWQDSARLVQVAIAREQPDGDLCVSTYLIDRACLGVKDALAKAGVSRGHYEKTIRDTIFKAIGGSEDCPLELAHQMIYQAVDYAAQYGFQPHKDFELAKQMLIPRGELEEPYTIEFGKNGKPFYVSGPFDDPEQIIKQLYRTAGPGNFNYLLQMGPPDGDLW